jgi:hypothetical protein
MSKRSAELTTGIVGVAAGLIAAAVVTIVMWHVFPPVADIAVTHQCAADPIQASR